MSQTERDWEPKTEKSTSGGTHGSFVRSLLLGAGSVALAMPASANDQLIELEKDHNQWVSPTQNYANTRYSTLDQINKGNVGDLQVAWTFSTGVLRGHEGGPLVIGDTMYVHAPYPNTVFALDLNNDGAIKWKYEPVQDPNVISVMCCDTVNRGPAYAPAGDGYPALIILHQADTAVVALNADTGEEVWKVVTGDVTRAETGTNAPMVVKDKVLSGVSGAEYGVQGYLVALNLKDGSEAWRAFSVGPDSQTLIHPENTTHLGKPVGKDSGHGDLGRRPVEDRRRYDAAMVLLRPGARPRLLRHRQPLDFAPNQRPGDNRWSMTIFARDPDDGMAKWVYQMTPHDEWDYDGVNGIILADIDVVGTPTKTLVHFDRNGLAYTLNRETGELLVAEKYDPVVNWTTGVDMDKNSPTYGRPKVVDQYSTEVQGEDVDAQGSARPRSARKTSSRLLSRRRPTCSTCRPTTSAWTTAVQRQLHGGTGLCRRHPLHVSGAEQPRRHGQVHRLGRRHGSDQMVEARAVLGLGRRARHCRGHRLLRNAGRLHQGDRLRDRRRALCSRPRPASSATRSPTRMAASSMSRCCRASAAGPASASQPGCSRRRTRRHGNAAGARRRDAPLRTRS